MNRIRVNLDRRLNASYDIHIGSGLLDRLGEFVRAHYLGDRERVSREYFVGDVREKDLIEIWNNPEYQTLRKRLQDFDFSPCAFCNSCEMANENLEDCYGNIQPTCGGCLWARGLIRCP